MAAGIGAYLYTALAAVVLPLGPSDRQVQCIRRNGRSDLLVLSPATEAWLRDGHRIRMGTEAVLGLSPCDADPARLAPTDEPAAAGAIAETPTARAA